MATKHPLRRLLHRATHLIPGVPAHAERQAGHQGTAVHGTAPHLSLNHRPPRFMPAWQRRIAAIFGREP